MRPGDKIKHVSFNGIDASFYTPTPLELRIVETPFEEGMGDERIILTKILNFVCSGDVVYDIGASIGIHTVFLAKKVLQQGRVIAIEPESKSYASLLANLDLNDLTHVIPLQIALGGEFLEGMLYSRGGTGDYSLTKRFKHKNYENVRIVPGDVLVREKKLPFPRVLKIDVEGYEYHVIQGLEKILRRKGCEMVCCEVHPMMLPGGIKPYAAIDLLKSWGFNQIDVHPRGQTFHAFCYKD
jgi:FkbM family methyltransferase